MKSFMKVFLVIASVFSLSFTAKTNKSISEKEIENVRKLEKAMNYPHPNIQLVAWEFLQSGGKTLRTLHIFIRLYEAPPNPVEIMFKIRLFKISNPNQQWYIYPAIMIPSSGWNTQGDLWLNLGHPVYGYDADMNDFEVWSYCDYSCD